MKDCVDELKTRARLRLNAARREDPAVDLRLRDCLHDVARAAGFAHWEQARSVLGGLAAQGDDMGTFWHAPRTGIILNIWCATYAKAQEALRSDPQAFLLPYRRQFMVVQGHFLAELGLDPADPAWDAMGHDVVAAYGSAAWRAVALKRLAAPLSSFASS